MSLLLSFLLTSFSTYACPQIDGVYTCTSNDEVYELNIVRTLENETVVYEILEEGEKVSPFDLRFITDNISRTQEEPLIDEGSGQQIGTMVVTKKALCANNSSLNFDLDVIMNVMGMKMHKLYTADLHSTDSNNFTVDSIEVNVEADGSKKTQEEHSVCVKK